MEDKEKEKISEKLKGIKRSEATRKLMSQAKKTPVSKEVEQTIVDLYTKERKTVNQCGAQCGLKRAVVERILSENGIQLRSNSESHSRPIDDKVGSYILEMYNSGHTIKECSKAVGLKNGSVYGYIKEHTVLRKTKSYLKGRPRTEETKDKISLKNKGHKVSDDSKARLSRYNKSLTKKQLMIRTSKAFLTKKAHGTFNTSSEEKELYSKLLKENVNKTVYRQYRDLKRYPFYCDFYIVENDLFIELNAHWTHGGHPFNKDNPEDIKKLNEWKEKSKTSKFYKTAIEVWTARDVQKQKVAKENHLNYKVIY